MYVSSRSLKTDTVKLTRTIHETNSLNLHDGWSRIIKLAVSILEEAMTTWSACSSSPDITADVTDAPPLRNNDVVR